MLQLESLDIENIETQLKFYDQFNKVIKKIFKQLKEEFPELENSINFFVDKLEFKDLADCNDDEKEIINRYKQQVLFPWVVRQVKEVQNLLKGELGKTKWLDIDTRNLQLEEIIAFFVDKAPEDISLTKGFENDLSFFTDFITPPKLSLEKDMFGYLKPHMKTYLKMELINFSMELVFGLGERYKKDCILIKLQSAISKAIENHYKIT